MNQWSRTFTGVIFPQLLSILYIVPSWIAVLSSMRVCNPINICNWSAQGSLVCLCRWCSRMQFSLFLFIFRTQSRFHTMYIYTLHVQCGWQEADTLHAIRIHISVIRRTINSKMLCIHKQCCGQCTLTLNTNIQTAFSPRCNISTDPRMYYYIPLLFENRFLPRKLRRHTISLVANLVRIVHRALFSHLQHHRNSPSVCMHFTRSCSRARNSRNSLSLSLLWPLAAEVFRFFSSSDSSDRAPHTTHTDVSPTRLSSNTERTVYALDFAVLCARALAKGERTRNWRVLCVCFFWGR